MMRSRGSVKRCSCDPSFPLINYADVRTAAAEETRTKTTHVQQRVHARDDDHARILSRCVSVVTEEDAAALVLLLLVVVAAAARG